MNGSTTAAKMTGSRNCVSTQTSESDGGDGVSIASDIIQLNKKKKPSEPEEIPAKSASAYVLAVRPWSFNISLEPVFVGAALAYKVTNTFNLVSSLITLSTTCLTVLCVHAAGNVVNTYFDHLRGVDSKRRSDDRTLVDNLLTPDDVIHLGQVLYACGLGLFIVTFLTSDAELHFYLASLFFGGLSSSFLYTGGIGLKYMALGDVLVMVTFGPVCVLYSFMAQAGKFEALTLLYAIPLALNIEAVLHSNNTRDRESDSRAGALTLAILLGRMGSYILYALLLFIPYVMFAVVGLSRAPWFLLPLITLPRAFDLEKQCRSGHLHSLPKRTATLNVYFSVFYILGILMSPRLPGLNFFDKT